MTKRIDILRASIRSTGEPALIWVGIRKARCSAKDITKIKIAHRKNGFWHRYFAEAFERSGREHAAIMAIKL